MPQQDQPLGYGQRLNKLFHEGIWNTEKKLTGLLGIDPNLLEYSTKVPAKFGFEDDDPYADALRHIFLAGELQRTAPRLAGPLLWGHEAISGRLHGQKPEFREMDYTSNEIGRALGRDAGSRGEVELKALLNLPWAGRYIPPGMRRY